MQCMSIQTFLHVHSNFPLKAFSGHLTYFSYLKWLDFLFYFIIIFFEVKEMENDLIYALIIALFIPVGIRALAYIYIYIYMLKKLVWGKFSKSCGSLEGKKVIFNHSTLLAWWSFQKYKCLWVCDKDRVQVFRRELHTHIHLD